MVHQVARSKCIHLRLCSDVSDTLSKPPVDKADNLTPAAQKLYQEGQQTINKNTGKPYFEKPQDLLDWAKHYQTPGADFRGRADQKFRLIDLRFHKAPMLTSVFGGYGRSFNSGNTSFSEKYVSRLAFSFAALVRSCTNCSLAAFM